MSFLRSAAVLTILILGVFIQAASSSAVVVGYYPSWKRQYMSSVDFSKYTHVNMAFAIPASDGSFTFEGESFLPSVVSDLHGKGVKVLMSLGGWTGSSLFSRIMNSDATRNSLISNIINYLDTNNLDGIDIDWEYPGRLGNTCNVYDVENDYKNYLSFLQGLRSNLDEKFGSNKKLVTIAVRVEPFDGPNGPISDVSEFAKVVDFANIMQYDINGGWNTQTGPNAPLEAEPGKGAQLSFASAIAAWTGAGWPANQLTAGLAFYGRSTTALEDMTQDPDNMYQKQSTTVPLGDSEDASWYDECAGTTSNSGIWQWKNMIGTVLSDDTTPISPWVRTWDSATSTPWLFNPSTKQFISYDDPKSIKLKVDYAAAKGLLGTMVWSANMDRNNELLGIAAAFGSSGSGSGGSGTADTGMAPTSFLYNLF
ncbi:hypothetical protein FBU59_000582 [Linderina macrospora]|uniref:Uncharacterized protein n=1 Tax=Linderina macrospora TaxID=4868 RepID=A0ACC1JG85_9FUNG|nr:hypothetical protein FBU59_000582 [Linderina macrospora]